MRLDPKIAESKFEGRSAAETIRDTQNDPHVRYSGFDGKTIEFIELKAENNLLRRLLESSRTTFNIGEVKTTGGGVTIGTNYGASSEQAPNLAAPQPDRSAAGAPSPVAENARKPRASPWLREAPPARFVDPARWAADVFAEIGDDISDLSLLVAVAAFEGLPRRLVDRNAGLLEGRLTKRFPERPRSEAAPRFDLTKNRSEALQRWSVRTIRDKGDFGETVPLDRVRFEIPENAVRILYHARNEVSISGWHEDFGAWLRELACAEDRETRLAVGRSVGWLGVWDYPATLDEFFTPWIRDKSSEPLDALDMAFATISMQDRDLHRACAQQIMAWAKDHNLADGAKGLDCWYASQRLALGAYGLEFPEEVDPILLELVSKMPMGGEEVVALILGMDGIQRTIAFDLDSDRDGVRACRIVEQLYRLAREGSADERRANFFTSVFLGLLETTVKAERGQSRFLLERVLEKKDIVARFVLLALRRSSTSVRTFRILSSMVGIVLPALNNGAWERSSVLRLIDDVYFMSDSDVRLDMEEEVEAWLDDLSESDERVDYRPLARMVGGW